jgi:undecaprenyl-diphosphatase
VHPLQFIDLVALALVEGVANILPIDATAHALLASRLLGWRVGSIGVAIHLGTVLALLVYLWRDVVLIVRGLWALRRMRVEAGTRLFCKCLLCAAPLVLATTLLGGAPIPALPAMAQVGAITLVSALAMGMADRFCMTLKRIEHLTALGALLIGLAELLSLVPGAGRVAMAIVMGRVIGLERPAAYRFVLLASVPALLHDIGSGGVLYMSQGVRPDGGDALAAGLTFVLVLIAAALGTGWINRVGLRPFVVYRLAVGAALLALAFT